LCVSGTAGYAARRFSARSRAVSEPYPLSLRLAAGEGWVVVGGGVVAARRVPRLLAGRGARSRYRSCPVPGGREMGRISSKWCCVLREWPLSAPGSSTPAPPTRPPKHKRGLMPDEAGVCALRADAATRPSAVTPDTGHSSGRDDRVTSGDPGVRPGPRCRPRSAERRTLAVPGQSRGRQGRWAVWSCRRGTAIRT